MYLQKKILQLEENKMTKEQKQVLTQMLSDENIIGKKLIDRLIWLNEAKPKFKVGDYYKVTDKCRKLYGNRVIDFNGKIVKIERSNLEKMFVYQFEVIVKLNESHSYTAYIFLCEDDIHQATDTNINYITDKTCQ